MSVSKNWLQRATSLSTKKKKWGKAQSTSRKSHLRETICWLSWRLWTQGCKICRPSTMTRLVCSNQLCLTRRTLAQTILRTICWASQVLTKQTLLQLKMLLERSLCGPIELQGKWIDRASWAWAKTHLSCSVSRTPRSSRLILWQVQARVVFSSIVSSMTRTRATWQTTLSHPASMLSLTSSGRGPAMCDPATSSPSWLMTSLVRPMQFSKTLIWEN